MLRRKCREIYYFFSTNQKKLDNRRAITYKLEFIDSSRFISTSLLKLVDNSSEIYSKKCRDKKCKPECDFKGLKNNKLSHNCKGCRKTIKTNKWID